MKVFLSLVLGGLWGLGHADDKALDIEAFDLISHAVSDPEGKAAFTFKKADFSGEPASRSELPIGVFDSGIGGLTVLEAILTSDHFDNATLKPGADGRPDFENESFIYFGDQANMPYGNYSAEGRTETLREHILKDVTFLLGRRSWSSPEADEPGMEKPPVKAVVIACNTATAYGLDDIRAACKRWDIPVHVIGVVEAGARGLQSKWKEKQSEAVAVFATVGTCSSGAYPRMVQSTLGRAGYGPATITQAGSADLAGALEGAPGFQNRSVKEIIRADIGDLVKTYREDFPDSSKPIGSVMLGCTHFPLAQEEIDEAFTYWKNWTNPEGEKPFAALIAEQREFIDPAEWTARQLFTTLASDRLRNSGDNAVFTDFYLSVPNPDSAGVKLEKGNQSFTYDYKYGRSPNELERDDTKIVPLDFESLPASSRSLILDRLPKVAAAITAK